MLNQALALHLIDFDLGKMLDVGSSVFYSFENKKVISFWFYLVY